MKKLTLGIIALTLLISAPAVADEQCNVGLIVPYFEAEEGAEKAPEVQF